MSYKILNLLLNLIEQNKIDGYKVSAAIVRKNKILASGSNVHKTHTRFGVGKFGNLHAESNAIRQAVNKGVDIKGATIYVYRRNKLLAKPCADCQALIDKYKINKVKYSPFKDN